MVVKTNQLEGRHVAIAGNGQMSRTFDQIEREWLAGSRIAVDTADIIAAFNRCERVLGRDWIDLAHRGSVEGVRITGAGPTFRVVSIGLSLASLDDVAD